MPPASKMRSARSISCTWYCMVSRSSNRSVRCGPMCRVRARLWAMTSSRKAGRFWAYSSRPMRSLRSSLCMAAVCISVFTVLDGSIFEKVFAQFVVEALVLAAYPLQHHGRVLDLLVAVMGEDARQFLVLAGGDPLVVPVHRFQFFHQRHHGAVEVPHFVCHLLDRLVIPLAGHARLPFVATSLKSTTRRLCGVTP